MKLKTRTVRMPMTAAIMAQICAAHGIPEPVAEFIFSLPRKWRFDWAWPKHGLALEVEGGIWTGGRHNRGAGFLGDIEKYNRAAILGWKVLRCTPAQLNSGTIFETIKAAL